MHVIAMEYPGYGIYPDLQNNSDKAQRILSDAEQVVKFLTQKCGWLESDLIVCGRSIGSGPACHIAANHKNAALVLISPHTSIRGVVKDFFFGAIA